jgi:Lon protease-like protein
LRVVRPRLLPDGAALAKLFRMAAQSPLVEMPLFPLATVLYPDGQLSLRIFEPRYLNLVRECTRHGTGFGVCLILQGREAGAPAVPAAIGTIACITDFHSDDSGLLTLLAEGGPRFRAARSRARSDGLLRGGVEIWPTEPELAVPVEFALLQTILERLIETMGSNWRHAPRSAYDNASWVGFRLAELLPLDLAEQQHMLELNDPVQRLAELRDILPRFQKP